MISRYLTPLAIMFLSGAIYVLYVNAPYVDIASQRERAEVLQAFINDAKNANEQVAKISAQYEAFPPDADYRLGVMLPDKVDPLRLVIDMNEVVQRHGMKMTGPSVGSGVLDEATGFASHKISFSTTATYRVFREFLADLESSLALREISDVSFSAGKSAQTSGDLDLAVYTFELSITTFGSQ